MTGAKTVLDLQKIWRALLAQLVCQVLLLVGLVLGDVVASLTGSYEVGYATTLVMTAATFTAEMVAWVQIVAALGGLKDASPCFERASRWYLVSFCLVFLYFVCHSMAGALQEVGVANRALLDMAELMVAALKSAAPLVALWNLLGGYADYLDSLGESSSRLRAFGRIRDILVAITVAEVALSLPMAALESLAPNTAAHGALSYLLLLIYAAGFCVQVAAVTKARLAWKTVEGMLE